MKSAAAKSAASRDESVENVRTFLETENRRDWVRWASFLHPDVIYEVIGQEDVTQGCRDYVLRMQSVYTELPDWRFDVLRACGDGSSVMVELDGRGHFTGEHAGDRCEGVPLRLTSVCVFELEGGRIRRVREYLDDAGFDRQVRARGRGASP